MSDLFSTGIRPAIDAYLTKKSEEERDYGSYWSASSAGYCMRLNILRRLKVPKVPEIAEDAIRTQRVFECGHIFHEWAQRITKDAGLSVAQELELQDEDLMVRGHIDDLVLVGSLEIPPLREPDGIERDLTRDDMIKRSPKHLILYDYKTANSQAFNYKKDEIGHYHKSQLGIYKYQLRAIASGSKSVRALEKDKNGQYTIDVTKKIKKVLEIGLHEGRILTISKDDLRMREHQLMWSPVLEKEVVEYWRTLNGYWKAKTLPNCTCLNHDGGFLGKRSKKGKIYCDYFLNDKCCNPEWYADKLPEEWRV